MRTADVYAPAKSRLSVGDRFVAEFAPYALYVAEPADLMGGSTITGWRDHTGNGRHLTTLSGTAPTYTATSAAFANRPAVIFTGGYLTSTATFALDDCSFFVAFADMATATLEETPIGTNYATGYWLGRNSNNASKWVAGFVEPAPPYGQIVDAVDGYAHTIAATRSGTDHNVYVDAGTPSTKVGSAATLSATTFKIGGGAGGGNSPTSLHVALVAVFNTHRTAADVAAMQLILRGAWGLP